MERTIELPKGDFIVTSRGVEQAIPLAKLSPEILTECLLHGLTQKVADAASQAKAQAEEAGVDIETQTGAMMAKAVDALLAGEWSRRASGGGVGEEQRIARIVTRRLVKDKFGSKSEQWATFTGLDTAAQNEKLDEWFAANESVLAPERDAEMERRREAAKAKKAAKSAVDFSL